MIIPLKDENLRNQVMRQYTLHAQKTIYNFSSKTLSVSHPYNTIFVNNKSYYGRTLGEIENQYFLEMEEKEKEELLNEYYKTYPNLKIDFENDNYLVIQEKAELLKQIPHCMKITNEFFKREKYKEDQHTNLLLGNYYFY
jgi:hypothetical protein